MKKLKLSLGIAAGLFCGLFAVQPTVMPGITPHAPTEDVPSFGTTSYTAESPTTTSAGRSNTNNSAVSAPTVHQTTGTSAVTKATSTTAKTVPKSVMINNKEYPLRTYKTLFMPNDPGASQWWVTNSKLDQAWDIARGGQETVLAIIDTGFALSHEEFNGRWYTSNGESGPAASEQASKLNCTDRGLTLTAACNLIDENSDEIVDNETGYAAYENPSRLNCTAQGKALLKSCNRIDDDANGYVDDVTGWDFSNTDNAPLAGELNPTGAGTTHGTMVAGVAAATGNNAKGVAGADWGTKILPLQALDDDSYGNTLGVGRAIYYAIGQGVDVINLSLGSELPDSYVEEAVRAATAAGIVVVAAAGNDGCDCMLYPANYPEVVAVGALNASSQRASFSSWGENLDIMAPGTAITSATWTSSNATSGYSSSLSGTSFSSPLVAGMMTRLLSQRPSSTPLQLTAAVTESTNRLSLSTDSAHSSQFGFGTLDAYKASARMATTRSSVQVHGLAPVSRGAQLYTSSPAEVSGNYLVYQCESGSVGTTAVYEMTRAGSIFFTVSKAEAAHARDAGYSSSIFTYACLQQPHDSPQAVRTVDLYNDFRNLPVVH